MGLWLHLLGNTVLAVLSLSHDPLDESSVHTPTCTARALSGDAGQLPIYSIHLCQCVHWERVERERLSESVGRITWEEVHNMIVTIQSGLIILLSVSYLFNVVLITHFPCVKHTDCTSYCTKPSLTQTGEASGRGGQASSRGKVVDRADVDFMGQATHIHTGVPIIAPLPC